MYDTHTFAGEVFSHDVELLPALDPSAAKIHKIIDMMAARIEIQIIKMQYTISFANVQPDMHWALAYFGSFLFPLQQHMLVGRTGSKRVYD